VMLLQEESEFIEANNSGFRANVQPLPRGSGDARLKLRKQRSLRMFGYVRRESR
jgi:hypothetical protein